MAGGNFDNIIEIDSNGEIVPRGPFPVAPGETPTELYAWVGQWGFGGPDAFAAGSTKVLTANVDWETPNADHTGKFVPGPATGMAVATSTDANGKIVVYSWSESIQLRAKAATQSAASS